MNVVDTNDLAYWYPLVKDVVPTPATRIVHTDLPLVRMVDGEPLDGLDAFIAQLTQVGNELGWPCFLHTGHGSGKHDWEHTCFVPDSSAFPARVAALVEWSIMVDIMGLPLLVILVGLSANHAPFPAGKQPQPVAGCYQPTSTHRTTIRPLVGPAQLVSLGCAPAERCSSMVAGRRVGGSASGPPFSHCRQSRPV